MNEHRIDTILFDFDGTIMDTNNIIIESWQETFRRLTGHEADPAVILKTFGEPLEFTMHNFFPGVPIEESLEIYRSYQRENFLSSIELFPGIPELLDDLSQRQVSLALVTSRLKHTTMQAVDKFGLEKFFEYIITADDVTRHKPDPQSALIALDHLGSRPESSLMVGDTLLDVGCARNAGMTSALVAWSMTLADRIEEGFTPEEAPDIIIRKPQEILELL